jgi:hypothetical protein
MNGFCSRQFAIACALTLFSSALLAQTTTQVLSNVDTETSLSTTMYAEPPSLGPYTLGSTTLSMTCSASPVIATLSGPLGAQTAPATPVTTPPGGGNLLVDNNLWVTVTPSGGSAGTPTNVCVNAPNAFFASSYGGQSIGTSPVNEQYNCFSTNYEENVASFLGDDSDDVYSGSPAGSQTIDAFGGVGPVDIGYLISPALPTNDEVSVNIADVDFGGYYTASTLYITTNCTITGVSSGNISGNPINYTPGTTPTGLNQSFTFNSNTQNNQGVQLGYNLGTANLAGTLSPSNNGNFPSTVDAAVNPATFQPLFVNGSSFATSNCLQHSGEVYNGNPNACKLYTLECTSTSGSIPETGGYLCPISSADNEQIQDLFDGPNFTLQNIYTPLGVFNEGIGLLMASDAWTGNAGGLCAFDPLSIAGQENLPCPLNLLNYFSGPGGFGGSGLTNSPNSTFVSIYGVPEDQTSIFVPGQLPDAWVNTSTPQAYFYSLPPDLSFGAYTLTGGKLTALPNVANFYPSPIANITYGLSPAPASNVPSPLSEPLTLATSGPLSGVTILPSGATCSDATPTLKTQPPFIPPAQKLGPLADGQYLLYFYAQDCAGTQELQFNYLNNTTGWTTNFFTYPINIDTKAPSISISSPSQGSTFTKSQSVTVNYSCSDSNIPAGSSSGLVLCGTNLYAPQTVYTSSGHILLPTLVVGNNQTFTLYAVDGAGNISSATLTYNVIK